MSELVMDLRLVWDSRKLKEIDEAKAEYRKYRAEGYEIVKPDGTPLDRFMPYLEELIIRAKKTCLRMVNYHRHKAGGFRPVSRSDITIMQNHKGVLKYLAFLIVH